MKGLLLSLGLVALFALCAQSDIPVQPDFQDDKIVGKWYSLAVASNFDWYLPSKQYMKSCPTVITPTADGNLESVSTYPNLDRCEKTTMRYFKTDQPGRFHAKIIQIGTVDLNRIDTPDFPWADSGEDYDVRFVETNYEEYALMSMRKTKGPDVYTTVALLGRDKELRPELLAKFRNFCQEQGLGEDNILILPQTDQCMPEA
ncbi:lipocalin-like isoform X1 [Ascaphus truei]|uniref:lipocalin-like isoform X1 n=1 Tax=Ascaphus truei TaxID=8439 RepID=UPI003F593B4B